MVQHIAPDTGRRLTKVVTEGEKKSFRSAVGEWRQRNLEADRDYEVEIDGCKYFVGDLAEESHFRREMATTNKIHEETRILFLTALALVAKEEEIVVTTGLPVNQHTPVIKRDLEQLLCGQHRVRIKNGPELKLNIQNIGIVPEGIGLYWDEVLSDQGTIHNIWLATQPVVRILEVGSRTINLGTIAYRDQKRLYLDRESDTLAYGYMALEAAEAQPTDECLGAFARRIVADASKAWLSYNPLKDVILLGGGGVLTLGSWLKKHYPISLTARDPVYGNASGFRKMGIARWVNHR